MSKRDDKELEEIYKSIDETADKLKAVFLSEKNKQIKSWTKDIYEYLCNNASDNKWPESRFGLWKFLEEQQAFNWKRY